MTNAQKSAASALVLIKCLKWGGGIGAIIGLLIGGVVMGTEKTTGLEAPLGGLALGAFWGAIIVGAIPGAITLWFLFLVMLGQGAQAVRGDKDR